MLTKLCMSLTHQIYVKYLLQVNLKLQFVSFDNFLFFSSKGVLLYSLLAEPRLQHTKLLIVLTKMDLAYRQMRNEALLMLQLQKLRKQIRQNVTIVETSALTDLGKDKIIAWLAETKNVLSTNDF